MKFRKRPVVIDAVKFTGENYDFVFAWAEGLSNDPPPMSGDSNGRLSIETLEGKMVAYRGDWIIRGVAGEFYPCKPDIFAATYEEVSDTPPAPASLPDRLEELRLRAVRPGGEETKR